MKHIFIAGPYAGDQAVNVRDVLRAADHLLEIGYVPYAPHLTHFWDFAFPHNRHVWLTYHANWLRRCDALLRLPGQSEGADEEVDLATTLDIPVFITIGALVNKMPPNE
ncbi:hypothetical protein LCGC14_2230570 [marine sediment metagenome]|uniref:DUF7768 domain-containing protein n=1 Tax=marine sediment metagenome TaxID=412755 RepID=A0A0F9DW31_9ZZZZ